MTELSDDKSSDVRLTRFRVFRDDPVVPDQRIGHGDDLAPVTWISENLLIPSHGSVEADFPCRGAKIPKTVAAKNATVF